MCLLTVFYPNADVNVPNMREAAYNNPDGFGFAVNMGDHIMRFRSMDFDETLDYFLRVRETYPDTFALFHHRFATGGGNTTDNCHPFSWAFDERFAIGHNGVLPIKPGRRKSDTRIWAEHNLADVSPAALDDDNWFSKTEQWIGTNKIAVLSASIETKYSLYIFNEHLGHWENDVWYSNHSYEPYIPPKFSSRTVGYDVFSASTFSFSRSLASKSATESIVDVEPEDTREFITCSQCLNFWAVDENYDNLVCDECNTCWLCEENALTCSCHSEGFCSVNKEGDAIDRYTH